MNQELLHITGLLVAVLLGYLLGQARYWHDNRLAINLEIWKERCGAYKKLMEHLGALLKEPGREEEITYYDLVKLARNFQDWYFTGGGGLLLTEESRKKYWIAQEAIQRKLDSQLMLMREQGRKLPPETDNDYDSIRELLSALRAEISRDLLG